MAHSRIQSLLGMLVSLNITDHSVRSLDQHSESCYLLADYYIWSDNYAENNEKIVHLIVQCSSVYTRILSFFPELGVQGIYSKGQLKKFVESQQGHHGSKKYSFFLILTSSTKWLCYFYNPKTIFFKLIFHNPQGNLSVSRCNTFANHNCLKGGKNASMH